MTIDDVRRAHRDAGGHFFDRDTLRFFRSRIGSCFSGPGGVFFVTSEQFEDSRGNRAPRRYSVRLFRPDDPSRIDTVGKFQQHPSWSSAVTLAAALAAGYRPMPAEAE